MMKQAWFKDSFHERAIVLTGAFGLIAAATFVACSDDASPTEASGAAGSTSGGAGGASATGGSSAGGDVATCANDVSTAAHAAAVVAATETFLAALSTDQQAAVKYDKTLANAQKWSNFPTTFVARNGVRFGDMSESAQAAAVALAALAAGPTGSTLLAELREADEFLVTDGKASSTDYGRGLYYVSVHGTPSATSAWMLQIGGHHLAYNFMYGSQCVGATPLFDATEPTTWTDSSGKAHAPLGAQIPAMAALATSIAALPDAKLSGTFGDLINGPTGGGGPPGSGSGGGGDTKYPASLVYPTGTTGRGVLVSTLSADQQALVKTAIEGWVKNVADPISSVLLASYESDEALAQTYVGVVGSADLSTQGSYVRIDGPRVWIEDSVQGGIVYRGVVHHHTIWRDKIADYGAEYVSQ